MTNTTSTGTHQVGRLVREFRLHLANLLLPAEHKVDVGEAVRGGDGPGAQGHLTLAFPMKSRAGSSAVRELMAALQAELNVAADEVGTLHYCRFIAVDDVTVYLLADFDGRLDDLLDDLATYLGPILSIPYSDTSAIHRRRRWRAMGRRSSRGREPTASRQFAVGYSAYPGATALQIRSEAAKAGVELDPSRARSSFRCSSSCR